MIAAEELRITLIARDPAKPEMDWDYAGCHRNATAFLKSAPALRNALRAAVTEARLDVGRVIIDRTGDANEFLEMLASLPHDFVGDVLFIRDNGSGVLSATARGGDRVLYTLTAHDVRFYLEAHTLVTARVMTEMSA